MGVFYVSSQDQSHMHSSYSSTADSWHPSFTQNFTQSLNDHYFLIIYTFTEILNMQSQDLEV